MRELLRQGRDKTASGVPIPPPFSLSNVQWISAIRCIELFVEIFSESNLGPHRKWGPIFLIELVKVLLRFRLLQKTNGNILVYQDVPPRETNTSNSAPSIASPSPNTEEKTTLGKKNRKTLLDLQHQHQPNSVLSSIPTPTPSIKSTNGKHENGNGLNTDNNETSFNHSIETPSTMLSLLPPPPPKNPLRKILGESLHILRPLIYLISLRLYGRKSWKPYLLSLFTDVASRICTGPLSELTPLESSEIKRRMFLWVYYFLRSPFFEKFIGDDMIERASSRVEKIPFGVFLRIFFDYLMVYRSHYFYTSAS